MASSSSTPFSKKSFKYDVFLSFRGEDTRKSFVDHLYYALERKNIHTYKDDESIEKGRRISDELINSIQDSKCFIIVFSRNYAASSWCLDELVKIIECQKSPEQTAYPVFFDVEPSEVRQLNGKVGESFSKHEMEEAAGKWREALKEAADLAGWELKNTFDGHEAKFIQKIVEEISLELRSINFSVDEKLVGMESRTKDILLSLETGFNDVGMIGIKGMGGGGKTTLARAVFNRISVQFEGKSFVENVREVSKASLSGLNSLQRQILSDVSKKEIKDIPISSVYDGKNSMKKIMSCKKVIIVLDDVDHIEQLEALAGEPEWFKPGSRIIITTRDEQVLIAHRVKCIHDVNLLSHEEATRLFSRYAFGRDIPVLGYEKLSSLVVRYAAGLPLTIRVLGSFLCGKIEPEWIDALERLKTIPLKETLEKLELSYNGLEDDYKEIFLDVACILKGWNKEKAIRALESCGFHARNGLRVLEQKSLITVNAFDRLGMHDHIEEMGRNIVRRLHPNEPNKHSRLWVDEEIMDTLANSLGTRETRCIKLSTMEINPKIVMEGLGNMKELRFLGVFNDRNGNSHKNWKFDEVTQYFPNSLRCLHWHAYPFRCLPTTFQANNLGVLTMPYSRVIQLWEAGGERKVLRKLRFIDLRCSNLRTLDLRQALNLEKICLDRCVHLLELNMPNDCLKLISLNLSYTKLRTLNLGVTPNLETLNLEGCQDLIELHMNVGCPKVKYICLNTSKLEKLDLGLTPNIERLHLRECYNLLELHTPVGCLNKIVYLDLSGCLSFKSFLFLKLLDSPNVGPASELHLIAESIDVCPLHSENNFPKFRFTCLYREDPASSYGNVERLVSVGHCACTNLESVLRTICGLPHIRKLKLEGSIPEVPEDIDQLECLEELIISSKMIKHLPDGICMLKHLKSLELISCWYLEKLPEDLGRLECLEKLLLSECIFLRDVPNSICKMKRLKHFMLSYCVLVERLPEELGCLKCLQELYLQGTGINHLPQSIINLKGLRIFGSRWWLESYGFTSKIQTIFGTYYTVIQ